MSKKTISRIAIVLAVVGLAVAFKALGLGHYLTLQYIKESQAGVAELYAANRISVLASFMGIYIAVTSLSLPGATIMTLTAGALFGFTTGIIAVSFASTIGATIACVVSRYLLRDWVQDKFGEKLKVINKGIEDEGAFYLFTLRLIPAFPFWLINLVMGLTHMRLVKFFLVSQLGMLAGTMVYVNAGKELAKIDSLAGIRSPGLIASFVALGVFPLVIKKLMAMYKSKKARPAQE